MAVSSSVGFDAGWRLEFRPDDPQAATSAPAVAVDRAGYDADLEVSFAGIWAAPTFSATVDGLRQADVDTILKGRCSRVTIALGWRDRPGSLLAAGANLLAATGLGGARTSGLVTVLTGRITELTRTAGEVRYRTRFSGVDATWARLQRTQVGAPTLPVKGTVFQWVDAICQGLTPPIRVFPEGHQPVLEGRTEVRAADRVGDVLQALARAAYGAPHGRVPLFLRDGELHLGAWTPSVTGGHSWSLDAAAGLVEATPAPYEYDDPAKDDPFATSTADAWDVSLLGRPDLRVGDVVTIRLPRTVTKQPSGGVPALGALGAVGSLAAPVVDLVRGAATVPPRDFRVVALSHTLARTTGFTTKLRVEGVDGGPAAPAPLGEAQRVAETIDARIGTMARSRRAVDAGVVTAQAVKPGGERHAQRLDLDDGLAEAAPPNLAVRGALDTPATHLADKPYLTPFAYGGTGLVVPHYPGTRVLQLNHDGDPRNAVVAGCVWPEGSEPESRQGDWWLTLPTKVMPADAGTGVTPAPTGPVASDLVNAAGGRVINVLGLEITVGESLMPAVGKRPDDPPAGVVTVRAAAGNASISIDSTGTITIATDKEIRLSGSKVVMSVTQGVEIEKRTS